MEYLGFDERTKATKKLNLTIFSILDSHPGMTGALWVLCGVLLFTIIQKIFSSCANDDESNSESEGSLETSDTQNGPAGGRRSGSQPIKVAGYLNLLANSIDNFTQGLAVAASFLVSFRQGLLGTIAILCESNVCTVRIHNLNEFL